jgi:glycosyltransferase involved in cell wall biosynthesis
MNILLLSAMSALAGHTLSVGYLAKGLAAKGHSVFVGCRPPTPLLALLDHSDVKVIPMRLGGMFDFKSLRQIRDVVHTNHISIVNSQDSADRYLTMWAKFLYRLPARVVHTRRQMPSSSGGRPQAWLYYHGTDRIVAVSHGVKQALCKQGIPAEHIEVIHNGTPVEKYVVKDEGRIHELRKRYGISSEDIVIGCVARESKRKRQDQLLKALRLVRRRTKVLLVGTGMNTEYQRLIEPIRSQHTVFFCGYVSPNEVLNFNRLFDLHVLPSTMEGLSQALLEAMALEVPVIATRAGGNTDLIQDGENGYLFDDNNIEQLAEKIRLVIENREDRDRIVARAKRTALEDFSINKTIDRYETFFESLIRNSAE